MIVAVCLWMIGFCLYFGIGVVFCQIKGNSGFLQLGSWFLFHAFWHNFFINYDKIVLKWLIAEIKYKYPNLNIQKTMPLKQFCFCLMDRGDTSALGQILWKAIETNFCVVWKLVFEKKQQRNISQETWAHHWSDRMERMKVSHCRRGN